MCDPITATLIATAASTAVKMGTGALQSRQLAKGNKAVAAANMAAQRNFNSELDSNRERARAEFANSLDKSGRESYEDDLAEAITRRENASQPRYETKTFLPGQAANDPTSAVSTAITTSQNQGAAQNSELDTLLATLEGYGDASFSRDLQLKQNSNRIGAQADNTRGALDTLAAEQNAAQYAGDKYKKRADRIGAVGNLASALVGASGGFVGGGASATPTAAELTAGKQALINSGGNGSSVYGLY